MQKAKVQRYVAGKRPKYAPEESDDEDQYSGNERGASSNEEDENRDARARRAAVAVAPSTSADDRRLRRLMESDESAATTSKGAASSRREIAEPVVLQEEDDGVRHRSKINLEIYDDEVNKEPEAMEESPDEEADEEERMRRRLELKQKALQRQQELLEQEQKSGGSDEESDSEEESDEYEEEEEEYTDDEDEIAPRIKPVFVRKKDRVTIQEKEEQEEREKENELERQKLQEENKKQTKKMIEEAVTREKLAEQVNDDNIKCDFDTDDEKLGETDLEAWRLREVRRIKRDRDEKEALEREKQEIQRIRNMTDEERAAYLKANPKQITNAVEKKGKYKFMQKYYHRGAFFMDEEQGVFKRDYAKPTLEDHFDKTILPKVMQVKNFGMSGRTKYTHLLDQDTTNQQDNPWSSQEKLVTGKGGGTKQVFENPSTKAKRK